MAGRIVRSAAVLLCAWLVLVAIAADAPAGSDNVCCEGSSGASMATRQECTSGGGKVSSDTVQAPAKPEDDLISGSGTGPAPLNVEDLNCDSSKMGNIDARNMCEHLKKMGSSYDSIDGFMFGKDGTGGLMGHLEELHAALVKQCANCTDTHKDFQATTYDDCAKTGGGRAGNLAFDINAIAAATTDQFGPAICDDAGKFVCLANDARKCMAREGSKSGALEGARQCGVCVVVSCCAGKKVLPGGFEDPDAAAGACNEDKINPKEGPCPDSRTWECTVKDGPLKKKQKDDLGIHGARGLCDKPSAAASCSKTGQGKPPAGCTSASSGACSLTGNPTRCKNKIWGDSPSTDSGKSDNSAMKWCVDDGGDKKRRPAICKYKDACSGCKWEEGGPSETRSKDYDKNVLECYGYKDANPRCEQEGISEDEVKKHTYCFANTDQYHRYTCDKDGNCKDRDSVSAVVEVTPAENAVVLPAALAECQVRVANLKDVCTVSGSKTFGKGGTDITPCALAPIVKEMMEYIENFHYRYLGSGGVKDQIQTMWGKLKCKGELGGPGVDPKAAMKGGGTDNGQVATQVAADEKKKEEERAKKGSADSSAIVSEANTWKGTPYVFGGNTRRGIDCSGFTQQVMRKNGVNIPRTAASQWAACQRSGGTYVSANELQSGDLLYFQNTYKKGVSHTGIYVGNDQYVHAPKTGDVVRTVRFSTSRHYKSHWKGACRFTGLKGGSPPGGTTGTGATPEQIKANTITTEMRTVGSLRKEQAEFGIGMKEFQGRVKKLITLAKAEKGLHWDITTKHDDFGKAFDPATFVTKEGHLRPTMNSGKDKDAPMYEGYAWSIAKEDETLCQLEASKCKDADGGALADTEKARTKLIERTKAAVEKDCKGCHLLPQVIGKCKNPSKACRSEKDKCVEDGLSSSVDFDRHRNTDAWGGSALKTVENLKGLPDEVFTKIDGCYDYAIDKVDPAQECKGKNDGFKCSDGKCCSGECTDATACNAYGPSGPGGPGQQPPGGPAPSPTPPPGEEEGMPGGEEEEPLPGEEEGEEPGEEEEEDPDEEEEEDPGEEEEEGPDDPEARLSCHDARRTDPCTLDDEDGLCCTGDDKLYCLAGADECPDDPTFAQECEGQDDGAPCFEERGKPQGICCVPTDGDVSVCRLGASYCRTRFDEEDLDATNPVECNEACQQCFDTPNSHCQARAGVCVCEMGREWRTTGQKCPQSVPPPMNARYQACCEALFADVLVIEPPEAMDGPFIEGDATYAAGTAVTLRLRNPDASSVHVCGEWWRAFASVEGWTEVQQVEKDLPVGCMAVPSSAAVNWDLEGVIDEEDEPGPLGVGSYKVEMCYCTAVAGDDCLTGARRCVEHRFRVVDPGSTFGEGDLSMCMTPSGLTTGVSYDRCRTVSSGTGFCCSLGFEERALPLDCSGVEDGYEDPVLDECNVRNPGETRLAERCRDLALEEDVACEERCLADNPGQSSQEVCLRDECGADPLLTERLVGCGPYEECLKVEKALHPDLKVTVDMVRGSEFSTTFYAGEPAQVEVGVYNAGQFGFSGAVETAIINLVACDCPTCPAGYTCDCECQEERTATATRELTLLRPGETFLYRTDTIPLAESLANGTVQPVATVARTGSPVAEARGELVHVLEMGQLEVTEAWFEMGGERATSAYPGAEITGMAELSSQWFPLNVSLYLEIGGVEIEGTRTTVEVTEPVSSLSMTTLPWEVAADRIDALARMGVEVVSPDGDVLMKRTLLEQGTGAADCGGSVMTTACYEGRGSVLRSYPAGFLEVRPLRLRVTDAYFMNPDGNAVNTLYEDTEMRAVVVVDNGAPLAFTGVLEAIVAGDDGADVAQGHALVDTELPARGGTKRLETPSFQATRGSTYTIRVRAAGTDGTVWNDQLVSKYLFPHGTLVVIDEEEVADERNDISTHLIFTACEVRVSCGACLPVCELHVDPTTCSLSTQHCGCECKLS